jgi:polygalacturonase
MAKNEFKLSYTAEDINNKLGKVEEHSKEIDDLTKDIDNLSTFVTPQMFGAVGDGNTDDTNAIQAAFDAD